ncbi:prolyl oligopeptidase family serine peptidase [Chryseobacterium gotjawalense]|uniref:Prolyl oligopeptidase family serine peptidase n=1 Tax=Chryseobacterium gotjawalense TaxID=3042315 RepID=A0ABY8RC82_9FLAO|nr:prolyl oligopeptidase family serine peptidase [Chryseobacterium sp. wdc7]WHF51466.1 prolyl oligopeptidase family serine peptidase [Chryseobacterium sp. wdc7]WHF51889.1 prolyl oligopeptidase family serine peptidase [Chryseobacterium sp. wdc7]
MMVIKKKTIFLMVIYLMVANFSFAQMKDFKANEFAGHTYNLSWLTWSPDKKYVSFQKSYEYSSDTLSLINVKHPEKIIFQSAGIYPNFLHYSKKGHLFMRGAKTAQLLKLPSVKPIIWENITDAFYLEKEEKIAILQKDILRIYNEDAELIDEIHGVNAIKKNKDILFFTGRNKNLYELIKWTANLKTTLNSSTHKRMNIVGNENPIFFIAERDSATTKNRVKYINITTRKEIIFQPPSSHLLKNVVQVSKIGTSKFLMTYTTTLPKNEKSTVDIWYVNDRNLAKKFQNNVGLENVIWNPEKSEYVLLNNDRFPKHIPIGHGGYVLALDPTANQDYTHDKIESELYRYDVNTNRYEFLGKVGVNCYMDDKGKYLLSYLNQNWILYTISTMENKALTLEADLIPYFSLSGEKIIFGGHQKIAEYNISASELKATRIPQGFNAEIISGSSEPLGIDSRFTKNSYDDSKTTLIKILNPETSDQTLGTYRNQSFQALYHSSDDLVSIPLMKDANSILYLKSNYNKPPVLIRNTNSREAAIFHSNKEDDAVFNYKKTRTYYRNSMGIPLTGLLYYPAHYKKGKKYPMVVGIYELMRNQSNKYLRDGFIGSVEGFNMRNFLDRGYFIYLPDITYDGRGPGKSAVDAVESSLDALANIGEIDFSKVGLIGHSHGGYETNFIATQSKRFAAYVSGAGNSDLVRSFHSFNYNFLSPFYWQFEEQQYRIYKPFAADKNLYLENSPIYHAEQVSQPILLWAGKEDRNIAWDQSMEFYLGLRRNDKKVIALFYEKEGHSFSERRNREDLFVRIKEWFDFHLKGIKTPWISEMYQ